MEIINALLVLCEGFHLSPVDFPDEKAKVWSLDFLCQAEQVLDKLSSCRWFETHALYAYY